MYRQYNEPRRGDYESEALYQEALDAYDEELNRRAQYLQSKYNKPLNLYTR